MADSTAITTDARVAEVLEIFSSRDYVVNLRSDIEGEDEIFRFGTPGGGYVTCWWEQKIDIDSEDFFLDDFETIVDVYEQTDSGIAQRMFEALAAALSERVTLFAPSSADVVAESGL